MRILLAGCYPQRCEQLRQLLEGRSEDISVTMTCDGRQIIPMVHQHYYQVLVLASVLPYLPGREVLAALWHTPPTAVPAILYISGMSDCAHLTDSILLPNSNICAVIAGIEALMNVAIPVLSAVERSRRREMAAQFLARLEMRVGIKGHAYLIAALDCLTAAPWLINCVTTRLYPLIAQMFETAPECVERCIRHAIESTWSRCPIRPLQTYFGHSIDPERGKPTNREFLAMATAYVTAAVSASQRTKTGI